MKASSVREYYYLTKPGIVYGNVLTTSASFLMASRWHFPLALGSAAIGGTALVIASACVANNVIDRQIDQRMRRTSQRAMVTGRISPRAGLVFASVLGIVGFGWLVYEVHWLTALIGAVGYIDYLVAYGIGKRHSVHGTVIGSISGAMPIVAGYTAVTNRLDSTAALLAAVMVCWQMPHFHAISIYRRKDYAAAKLPVLSVARGVNAARRHIVIYGLAFLVSIIALWWWSPLQTTFLAIMGLISLGWLYLIFRGFVMADMTRWARQVFFGSLVVVLLLAIMLPLGVVLP